MKYHHPLTIALGHNIRKFRKTHGMSQEEFAGIVGLDRSYMGCIERGEQNITVINLVRVAKALGVEVGDLFPPIKSIKIVSK
jgi:transcriptional regulator with XRE-family HTH domain